MLSVKRWLYLNTKISIKKYILDLIVKHLILNTSPFMEVWL